MQFLKGKTMQLTKENIPEYLKKNNFISKGEQIQTEFLPSNINFVFRVKTQKRALILKQATGFLVRFPEKQADPKRLENEYHAL